MNPGAALMGIGAVSVSFLIIMVLLSFDTLEYQEIGLNYSWMKDIVQPKPYTAGRYYLGLGNHFIKFPQMVRSVYFTNDRGINNGPALKSRTKDGLTVHLEVSFQYRLLPHELYDLYTTLGADYEHTFIRMSIEQLTTIATLHTAHQFFNNRTIIGEEMQRHLNHDFKAYAFSEVPFFQLRTVHLPPDFEAAIQETQVKEQDIQIATAEQTQKRVTFATRVLQAKQAVRVMANEAAGEAQAILAQNGAYCKQYKYTQNLKAQALKKIMTASGWGSKQLIEYLRIRAIRDHESAKTMLRF